MKLKQDIRTESRFLFELIRAIIFLPLNLFLVLSRRKKAGELFGPLMESIKFLFEARLTISLILINVILFYSIAIFSQSGYLSKEFPSNFIWYPSNFFGIKIFTIVTSLFMHANQTHLWGNMLALFIFGRVVERKLGFSKTAIYYFGAGIISLIFSSLIYVFIFHENTGGLGASGAIMGLVSVAMLISPFYFTWELIIPIPIMVLGWLTIYSDITGIISPVQDNIGHFAHLGGFFAITLLFFLFSKNQRSQIKKGLLINFIFLITFLILYLKFVRRYF